MSYSFDLIKQLVVDLKEDGFTPEEITLFRSNGRLREFHSVVRGTHEIRAIDHIIDLAVPCKLPFKGAERVSPAKPGVLRLEKKGDDLYLDGRKINLFLSEKQKVGRQQGHELHKELEAKGGNLGGSVLDHLVMHPKLWPESWKKNAHGETLYVFFRDDVFRRPARGGLFVRCGYWFEGEVVSHCRWLDFGWFRGDPSASLAS